MHRRGLLALLGGVIVVALVLSMGLRFLLNPKIDQVVVRDMRHADFTVVRTISSAEELKAFSTIWSNREKLPPETVVQVQYKFEILSGGRGDAWLYDPAGLTRLLSKARTPVYRLSSPEVFNRLLGTVKAAGPEPQ
jgi:hypothetical protein